MTSACIPIGVLMLAMAGAPARAADRDLVHLSGCTPPRRGHRRPTPRRLPRTNAFMTARAMCAASTTDGFATTGARDPSGTANAFAGYEIDGRFRHWLIQKHLRAEWNGTLLLHRGVLRTAPCAPPAPTTAHVSAGPIASF